MYKLDAKLKTFLLTDNISILTNNDSKKYNNLFIVYRNYTNTNNNINFINILKFKKKFNYKILISNNVNLANLKNIDGFYIPSFIKKVKFLNLKKNILIVGSAHNHSEIQQKIRQGCKIIFLSSIFKNNKNNSFLGITKFNLLTLNYNVKFVALGGINFNNFKKIYMTRSIGIGGMTFGNNFLKLYKEI
jgi:thiamine monophosphate synthase